MRTSLVLLLLTVLGLVSCSEPPPTSVSKTGSSLTGAVTRDLAGRITNGLFQLPPPPSEERLVLSEQTAREIAKTVARLLGPSLRKSLEAQHEGLINFRELNDCGQAYFAQGAFESIPDDLPEGAVYSLGSQWIVGVCDKGVVAISVAVAANATRVIHDRQWTFGPPGSVSMVGVPPEWEGALPVSPERAAILASSQTSRLVASVPLLVTPNPGQGFPQGSRWILQLDNPISARGALSGSVGQTRAVIVTSAQDVRDAKKRGPVGLYVASPNEARSRSFYLTLEGTTRGGELRVRSGFSIDIEPMTIVAEGARP